MREKGFLPDVVNTLMDGYCKLNQIETAKGLLVGMEKEGVEHWNQMLLVTDISCWSSKWVTSCSFLERYVELAVKQLVSWGWLCCKWFREKQVLMHMRWKQQKNSWGLVKAQCSGDIINNWCSRFITEAKMYYGLMREPPISETWLYLDGLQVAR